MVHCGSCRHLYSDRVGTFCGVFGLHFVHSFVNCCWQAPRLCPQFWLCLVATTCLAVTTLLACMPEIVWLVSAMARQVCSQLGICICLTCVLVLFCSCSVQLWLWLWKKKSAQEPSG